MTLRQVKSLRKRLTNISIQLEESLKTEVNDEAVKDYMLEIVKDTVEINYKLQIIQRILTMENRLVDAVKD